MTDIELIKLAAKAAGVPLKDLSDRYDCWEDTPCLIHKAWNPITDDGDALRLAVKLKMGLSVFKDYAEATDGIRVDVTETVYDLPDIYAATRRAIVRAAAEIGKAMP